MYFQVVVFYHHKSMVGIFHFNDLNNDIDFTNGGNVKIVRNVSNIENFRKSGNIKNVRNAENRTE